MAIADFIRPEIKRSTGPGTVHVDSIGNEATDRVMWHGRCQALRAIYVGSIGDGKELMYCKCSTPHTQSRIEYIH